MTNSPSDLSCLPQIFGRIETLIFVRSHNVFMTSASNGAPPYDAAFGLFPLLY